MVDNDEKSEEDVEAVVDCILVGYQGAPESWDRIAQVILAWAEEHPDEWDELRARCQQRHAVFA